MNKKSDYICNKNNYKLKMYSKLSCSEFYENINTVLNKLYKNDCNYDQTELINKIHECSTVDKKEFFISN